MLDEREFARIKERFEAFDEKREAVIKESRDILKLSKQAIYCLHREDRDGARERLDKARGVKERLEAEIACDTALRTGGFSNAVEEYVEARAFLHFLAEEAILPFSEVSVLPEEYLLGLADLTGELCRRAVLLATKQDCRGVQLIHEAIEAIYGQFVQFDFRNGELRRKYDSIKYNLQKVERVLYDLQLRVNGDA